LKFDIGALQGLLQFVGRLAALGSKAAAMAGELPQVALLPAGNEAGTQQPVAQQLGDPLSSPRRNPAAKARASLVNYFRKGTPRFSARFAKVSLILRDV
jgi:hypothetical protein